MRAAGQGELGLSPDYPPEKVEKNSPKNGAKVKDKYTPQEIATNENSDLAEAPPQPTRARERASEARDKKEDIQPIESLETRASPLDSRDLKALLDACSQASGFWPTSPGQIDKAYQQVQRWRDAKIDFDLVVIPTIKTVVAASSDPTSSLARFDRKVMHEHARLSAVQAKGQAYRSPKPPEQPIMSKDGEPPAATAIREALLKKLGPALYVALVNPATFEQIDDMPGDRRPIRIHNSDKLKDGEFLNPLRAISHKHGYNEVW